jgi:hypothetical protein
MAGADESLCDLVSGSVTTSSAGASVCVTKSGSPSTSRVDPLTGFGVSPRANDSDRASARGRAADGSGRFPERAGAWSCFGEASAVRSNKSANVSPLRLGVPGEGCMRGSGG